MWNLSQSTEAADSAQGFAGWRMVALAAFIHTWSFGLCFGTFGVSVVAIEERFDTSRTIASSAVSLILLAITISAPILGKLYGRISIRRSVMAGCVVGASGYFALAITQDWRIMLVCYAILVGPGVALTGAMPTNVIVTNWFVTGKGKAMGIVNLPIGLVLIPLAASAVLQSAGLQALYLATGFGFLFMLPAAWALIDRPEQIGQNPKGILEVAAGQKTNSSQPSLTMRQILLRWEFWIITFSIGVIVAGASLKAGHLVPLLTEQGRSMDEASALLALSGGAGVFGSLVLGWLADRFGGALVLIGNAILQSMMWFVFLLPVNMFLLSIDAIIIGMCGGGVAAAQGVLLADRFGSANFSRALGLLGLTVTPFLVGINTLAGYLHDQTGNYRAVVSLIIVATGIVALALSFSALSRRKGGAIAAATGMAKLK